jgi:hypothetical protein
VGEISQIFFFPLRLLVSSQCLWKRHSSICSLSLGVGPRVLSYTEMLCVLVTLATSDTGVTSPRPKHHRQAGQN